MSSPNKPVLDSLVDLCARHLDECLERAVRAANAQLIDKIQYLSDSEQTDFGFATNLIESNVSWIVGKIEAVTLKNLKTGPVNTDDSGIKQLEALDEMNLSLVSKDEFEDWLLVDVSKKKLERELGLNLTDVCFIFSEVYGEETTASTLAIGPEQLLTGVKHAIDSLKIPSVTQITIYRSATASLAGDLERMYAEIISLGKRAEIDPEKSRQSSFNKARAESPAIPSPSDPAGDVEKNFGQGVPSSQAGKRYHQESSEQRYSSLNTLARLGASLSNGNRLGRHSATMAQQGSAEQGQAGSRSSGSQVPDSALLKQLAGSHTKSLYSASSPEKSLKEWVRTELSAQGPEGGELSSGDSELVDVTDSLFNALAFETADNSTLERWLSKLKIVILKSVLRDQSFFTESEHPARQMLNRLGDLADIVESGHSRLESILDRSIDKVVNDYDDDVNSIDEVVSELTALFERHVAAYKRNSERLARSYEGKQRVAKVRYHIVQQLNELICPSPFPKALLEVLDFGGWRDYMALCAIRDGLESESYHESLSLVSQIASWIRKLSAATPEEAVELGVEIGMEAPSLLDMLMRELNALGKSGYESSLNVVQNVLMGQEKPEFITLEEYEWPFTEGEDDLRDLLPKEESSVQKSRWHHQLLNMKAGDWLQLTNEDGTNRVLRLAWSGTESFRFVFVDSQGMKDEDMSIDELAERMKYGSARLIEHSDVPLVDQGLHRMVQSVYEELSGQANCDPLTGLLTRQALERALDQTTAMALTQQGKAVLLYADIDNFNVTNSTFGLAAGDATLKCIANMLRDLAGENAFCGRLGGNEFGLVLQGCDTAQGLQVAESVRVELSQNPPVYQGRPLHTDLSIGIAEIDYEIDDYDSILRKAEYACRQAKNDASESVVVYELRNDDEQRRSDFLHWISRLDGPLDSLLTLRVQEIRPIGQEDTRLSHWEILLGLKQEGQVIPPGPLIEAAENFGKMTIVDRWVISASLRWMTDNADFVNRSGGFSINLSGASLSDHHFLDFVEESIVAAQVDPSRICFEITETSAIVNLNFATEFIRVLKKRGCKFSLDDFGSGLSSYAYIQKLPVDYIKIDGMFVRNLESNENDRALVQSINELAHFMGMETVAEFVENHAILKILSEIGVDHSQGFGIRKPLLLEDLRDQ